MPAVASYQRSLARNGRRRNDGVNGSETVREGIRPQKHKSPLRYSIITVNDTRKIFAKKVGYVFEFPLIPAPLYKLHDTNGADASLIIGRFVNDLHRLLKAPEIPDEHIGIKE